MRRTRFAAAVLAAVSALGFAGTLAVANGADTLRAAYVAHGSPECLSAADLDTHVGYIVNAARIAGQDISADQARAQIATFIARGVPHLWWTRFARYPSELAQYRGPFAHPCGHPA